MKKIKKTNKGITLVALVITIVILLILAGITIAQLTENGLFTNAKDAKQRYKNAEGKENQTLEEYERMINELGGNGSDANSEHEDNTTPSDSTVPAKDMAESKSDDMFNKTVNSTVKDDYGNQVVIPAGFKIADDASNITDGIVIRDKNDNEFVWIPVGNIKDKEGNENIITLSRYTFDTSGNKTDKGEAEIDDDVNSSYKHKEETTSTYGNAIAKSLEEFKRSVTTNHGYYIGRYEARINGSKVTEKATDPVWCNMTQKDASTNCQAMYSNGKFISDLINSYAWDTAIVFLQTFDNREPAKKTIPYSRQTRGTLKFSSTGTNNATEQDKICNIYDMASNLFEWTTETFTNYFPYATHRGSSSAVNGSECTSTRALFWSAASMIGCRPILYCSAEN